MDILSIGIKYPLVAAVGFLGMFGAHTHTAVAAPQTQALVSHTSHSWEKVDEAQIALTRPMRGSAAYGLLAKASKDEPIEIRFRSGEWTGGIVVTGDKPLTRQLVRQFLESDPAAAATHPIYAIGASTKSVGTTLQSVVGKRSNRADFRRKMRSAATPNSTTADGVIYPPGGCLPDTDCDEWVNKDGYVPRNGQLQQVRMQGVVESTDHTLKNFSKRGYPAILHHVAYTQGHGGSIKPLYAYEHDYKITNNGYVQTEPNYDWSTNLPGAYRDTRASDSGSTLDFTIGTMFTWLLDGSKTYRIRTVVASPTNGTPTSSTALLTAQVLPNDGSFDRSTAAAGGGCSFLLDPTDGNVVPSEDTHNYAWCAGVGGGLGSQEAAYSYISKTPFTIKYTGTCRNWTLGAGAISC